MPRKDRLHKSSGYFWNQLIRSPTPNFNSSTGISATSRRQRSYALFVACLIVTAREYNSHKVVRPMVFDVGGEHILPGNYGDSILAGTLVKDESGNSRV